MFTPFTRTLAFLDREERSRRLGRFVWGFGLLALVWAAWLGLSKTTVYAVSEDGRLLAAGAASPVQSTVPGLVVSNRLALGQVVRAGDVLIELDASAEKLRRAEEQARYESLSTAIESLHQIIEAERGLAVASVRAVNSRTAAAATRAKVNAEIATLTKQQDDAIKRLREASLASGMDALNQAEALQRQRGQVYISVADAANAAADAEKTRREVEVRLLNLQRELGDLKGKAAANAALLAQLDWEITRRTLRASIDGKVADLQPLPTGSVLVANQVVATIVPAEKLRWVAYFSTREAVGRIHEGQTARIRMDAFPWTAYGVLEARVVSVGSEPREQRIRAEFELVSTNKQIPLAHGMSGTTEVEVETLSPLRLLLRLAGQAVGGSKPPPPAPASSAVAVRP